jgi:hypothetical protein
MNTKNFSLTAATLFAAGSALAQMPNASQQVDSIQQRRQLEQAAQLMLATNAVPELYAGEASDVGPQSVLRFKPRRHLLEAFADVQYFHTDNMFLARDIKQGADVLVSTVQAALAPTPYEFNGGRLAPRLGYQHQWFNYGLAGSATVPVLELDHGFRSASLDEFDFNAMTVFSDVAWSRDNWTFTLGGDFRRLMDSGDYSEFYREFVPRWSVRRDFFTSAKTVLSIGYEGDYRVTDTQFVPPAAGDNFNDRTDHSLVLVGSWRLCRYAILQPSYRFQYTHFTSTDRDDFFHSFGLTLYCPVTDNITLRGYVSYDNQKTDGFYVQSYQALSVGAGMNLTVRF